MRIAVAAVLLFLIATPAPAYLDGGGWQVTLPEIVSEFRTVTLVEVEKVNLSKGGFKFKIGKPLKGKAELKDLKLQMTWEVGGAPWKEMEAGRVGVHFTQSCEKAFQSAPSSTNFENLIAQRPCLTFIDGVWLHSQPGADGWQSGSVRRDFEMSFIGTTPELTDAISKLLRGNDVTVRCRRRKNPGELQWVRYSLGAPNNKAPARDPSAPAASSRPVAAWVADLRDPGTMVRMQAALALAEMGAAAKEAEAALLQTARDPDAELRYAAVAAIGAIGLDGKAAVEQLGRSLSDEDWFVQLAAAQALQPLGERARPALPAIIWAMSPRDSVKDFRPVRCGAAMVALARIDPKAKELDGAYRFVISRLLEDERQGSFGARATGARLLGDCGPAAVSTLPSLTKLLKDADGDVRVAASEAILKIAPENKEALPVLIETLKHPDLLVRRRAALALAGKGDAAKSALRDAVQDPEAEVRQAVQDALKK